MKQNRKIVLDTETTGLDYLIKDRVIEIAAIEIINDKELGKEFHTYINPNIKIDDAGVKIHGITNEFVKDKPYFNEIADDFLNFIGDSLIIAHNSEFDRSFLNLELYLLQKPILLKNKFIDTLTLSRNLFKGEKVSLDELCLKFNIDASSRLKHHGALIDTKLLAQVYIEITNIINNNISLNKKDINKILKKSNSNYTYKKQIFPYRDFKLKNEDNNNHTEFLEKKNISIWEN